jgi:2-methylcitrate dehydratase PrpD
MKAPIIGHASAGTPTEQLASFISDFDLDTAPDFVRQKASDMLLDAVASTIAGRHGDEVSQVTGAARALGQGTSTVVGGQPLSLAGAVLVNGFQTTAVNLCDMHVAALNHVTPGVLGASLGVAEQVGASGKDLLRAFLVGVETSVRLGRAINFPAFRERGWHAPGVIGTFGAAAAVASLLRLSKAQTINALGLAGSQSAGTYAAWGTPTVKFHQTRGGLSGTMAGLLAAEDFRSSADFLSHPDGGLFNTYTQDADTDEVTRGLGRDWVFDQVSLRRWPAATQFQSMIEALLDLVRDHDLALESVEAVNIQLPVETFGAFGGFGWEDKFRARLSPRYVAAAIIADRRCWLDQFEPDRLVDPVLTDFAGNRVHVVADESVPGVGVRVQVRTAGAAVALELEVPKGDPQRPLLHADIVEKFHDARQGALSDAHAERVLSGFESIESIDDVRPLIGALAAG